MFHKDNRDLQAKFGSTELADRLVDEFTHKDFSEGEKKFIENAEFFFLATADSSGHPDCSFKGGPKGFVRIVGPDQLVFPDYDGNGMFKSTGNIQANSHVGLLFISMDGRGRRIRVNGTAKLDLESDLLPEFAGAQMLVTVTAEHIFPNCPRYIPDLENGEKSIYHPIKGKTPIEPAWKSFEQFEDIVPPRKT